MNPEKYISYQKNDYNKCVRENVIKTYKRFKTKKIKNKNFNFKSKLLAENLAIDDRIKKMKETSACIPVKDHKEGFLNKLSLHLNSPSKSDIGKISKNILDKINQILILNTK